MRLHEAVEAEVLVAAGVVAVLRFRGHPAGEVKEELAIT